MEALEALLAFITACIGVFFVACAYATIKIYLRVRKYYKENNK